MRPPTSSQSFAFVAAVSLGLLPACGSGTDATDEAFDVPSSDAAARSDATEAGDASIEAGDASASDAAAGDGATAEDASEDASDGGLEGACYVGARALASGPRTLAANRDRLVADLARRKCTDACTLWSALNQAERYVFLMDTAYLGSPASRVFPPSAGLTETALDHATAMYSINGPKAGQGVDFSGRGGGDYNRVYLGFDALATCVMREFAAANPSHAADWNAWVKSDDLAGAHAPFTQREMIYWYKAWYDLQSNGPQFHHWASDADFDAAGLASRLGVCGVTDRSLTELTIAFDYFHNSDPLGDYSGRGGMGWEIVDQYVPGGGAWDYTPTGCAVTSPVNTDPYGGGTFAGMGAHDSNGACVLDPLPGGGPCAPSP